mmetsp:Transcript_10341/g.17053  ORF Transcript_10341/g.17053 Transcript_10341/m.17053 type:complete len:272 (-) Transcript_10341:22-837(-)
MATKPSMTNRSNSSSEDLRSVSNTSPPPPSLLEKINSTTSKGNAPNGLNHTTRISCTVPILTEDQSTHDAIMDKIRKKKVREFATMQAARLKKQQQLEEMNDDKNKDKERARKQSRERASAQVDKGMEHLDKLQSEKINLEGSVMAEWREKIVEFEQQMSDLQKKELDALKLEHDGVVDKMLKDITEENNMDKLKLTEALNEVGEKKRKLDSVSTDGTAEEKELQSVVKQKELKTIMEEMNDLNKTKGQMVWLLKQVITAELMKKKKSKPE